MNGKTVLSCALAACVAAAWTGAAAVELTASGTEVVTEPKACPTVRFAASELAHFLGRTFGAEIPVVTAPTAGRMSIFLGDSAWSREAGISLEGKPRDTFVTKVEKGRVFIVGRDDPHFDIARNIKLGQGYGMLISRERATVHGVYDFLERHAGMRFYFPDEELGIVAPRMERIAIPEGVRETTPSFLIRNPYLGGDGRWFCEDAWQDGKGRGRVKTLEYLRLRCSTINIPCCHGSRQFKYIERFGKKRPECLALKKDGARWDNPKANHAYQLCWTSPVLKEEMYQDVKAYLTGQPASSRGLKSWGTNCQYGEWVDIMPEDSFQGCACANCQAAYRHLPGDSQYASELMWGFTGDIGRRLIAEGVKGNVTMMAYTPYRRIPDVALPTNVHVMVAEGGPWSLVDPKRTEHEYAEIRAWAKKLGHPVWIWTYPHKWGATQIEGLPCMAPRAWGRYYQGISDSIFGTFAECETENGFFNYLNYYVFSRVCWDAKIDIDSVIAEHHRLMFGAAADDMAAYYDLLERKWTRDITGRVADTPLGPVASAPSAKELWCGIFSPEVLADMDGMLKRAVGKVSAGSVEAKRIALVRREFFDGLVKAAAAYRAKREKVAAHVYDASCGKPLEIDCVNSRHGNGHPPPVRTRVAIRRTATHFIAEFDCEEPMLDQASAIERKRDEFDMWQDNGVEMMLNPSGDGSTIYHFMLTSAGCFSDTCIFRNGASGQTDREYDSRAKRSVERTAGGWKATIEVPLDAFAGGMKDSFQANFCRSRAIRGSLPSYIMWSREASNYHDFENFGTIIVKGESSAR